MKKMVLLIGLLVLAGCDGPASKATKEPRKTESSPPEAESATPEITATAPPRKAATPDLATEAEAVMRRALDDWVFGEAHFRTGAKADIDFGDLYYNIGNPLSSYEVVAVKEVDTDEAKVAIRLSLPTRGGIAEIKKNISYTVLKNGPKGIEITGSRWMIGPAGVNDDASGEN